MEKMKCEWFEKNPTKSVILYTLTIAAVSWAAFVFLLDERKEKLHKNEIKLLELKLGDKKLKENQLEARIDFLEGENLKLREQNFKYYEWISINPSTVEFIKKENNELRNELYMLKKEKPNQLSMEHYKEIKKVLSNKFSFDSISFKEENAFINELITPLVNKYSFESSLLKVGSAFIDKLTGVSISVTNISIFNDADGHYNFPEGTQQDFNNVKPGTSWTFKYQGRKFDLYLQQIDYAIDMYKVRVKEK